MVQVGKSERGDVTGLRARFENQSKDVSSAPKPPLKTQAKAPAKLPQIVITPPVDRVEAPQLAPIQKPVEKGVIGSGATILDTRSDVARESISFKDSLRTMRARIDQVSSSDVSGVSPSDLRHPASKFDPVKHSGKAAVPAGRVRQLPHPGVTQGQVQAAAERWPDNRGFSLVLDSYHWAKAKGGNDQVSFSLKLNAGKSGEKTLDVKLPTVITDQCHVQCVLNMSFTQLAALIHPLPVGNDVRIDVEAHYQKPNTPSDRGHTSVVGFMVPATKKSGVKLVKADFGEEVPINLPRPEQPKAPPTSLIEAHPVLEAGEKAELVSMMETEAELTLPSSPKSEKAIEAAVIGMYELARDPEAAAKVFGPGWKVIPVDKYFLPGEKGPQLSERGAFAARKDLAIGKPGMLTDHYFDTADLAILKSGGSARVRENFRLKDLLNVKGASVTGADKDSMVRLCANTKLVDGGGARTDDILRLLKDPASGPLHEALASVVDPSGLGTLSEALTVNSERHRFRIFREGGANIELSFDFSEGRFKTGETHQVYGLEFGLEHLGASAKDVESGPSSSKPIGLGVPSDLPSSSLSKAKPPVMVADRHHDRHDLAHASLHNPKSSRNADFLHVRDTVLGTFFEGAPLAQAGNKPNQLATDLGKIDDSWKSKVRVDPSTIPPRE